MLAQQIMKVFEPYRRVLQENTPLNNACQDSCFHIEKLQRIIKKNQKIQFVLPAFPAKSPNLTKTMGYLPDLGERLALTFLDDLCKEIGWFYKPGAEIIICSDGRVFNDLVNVSDQDVNAYTAAIRGLLDEDALQNLSVYGLDDYYIAMSYGNMRARLIKEHGESIEEIKKKIKENDAEKNLFNGMHRFIFEDHLSLLKEVSKNKVRDIAKDTTYQVIQRSHAWSHFLQKIFPDAMRLSIHPQPCGSEKMGIMLLKSRDVWATPWHRVVLFDGEEHVLVRKKEAEALGGIPIYKNKQFSHFVL